MTTSAVLAKEARSRISTDHAVIRGLLAALAAMARAALTDEKQRSRVRALLAQVRAELEHHFAYEEAQMAWCLAEARSAGIEHLLRDHAEQREVLVALTDDAEDGARSIEDLTDELLWFTVRFEEHMTQEEEELFPSVFPPAPRLEVEVV